MIKSHRHFRYSYILALILTGVVLTGLPNLFCAESDAFVYNVKDRRDPFIPLLGVGAHKTSAAPSISIDSLKLEGVVVDPKQGSFIMVDGEVYGIGDLVGPYKVEKIEENRVVLKYNKEQYELKLQEDIVQ